MKTFLGFTTGVLTGTIVGFIGGLFFTVYNALVNKDVREMLEKDAFDE